MQREQGRHESASPGRCGHPVKEKEQEERVQDVEQQVVEMVAHGVQAIECDVQHVGDPCQWMPVAGVDGDKGPSDIFNVQSPVDVGIFSNIIRVVKVGKIMVLYLPVNRQGDGGQEQADKDLEPPGIQLLRHMAFGP